MSGEHEWFRHPTLIFDSCKLCGIIKRADGRNKPCRGLVKIGLRSVSTPTQKDTKDG